MEVRAVGLVVENPKANVAEDDCLVKPVCLGDFYVEMVLHVLPPDKKIPSVVTDTKGISIYFPPSKELRKLNCPVP